MQPRHTKTGREATEAGTRVLASAFSDQSWGPAPSPCAGGSEALWFRQAEAAMYHYIPFLRLATSAHFIVTLSVALTLTMANPARGAYSAKDFERCRADGGSIAACCRSAGGYLNQDATKCMASYLFRGPSRGDDGEKKPGVAPKFPTQTDSN